MSPIAANAPSVHDPFYIPPVAPTATTSGQLPMSLAAPAIPTELAKPAKTTVVKMGRGRYGTAIVLLVLLLFLVGLLGSPALVRRSFVDALAQRGITATIEEVDLYSQIGTARIVGLSMSSPEVPGATLRAHEVLVDLNGNLEPKSVAVHDVDANVEVGYAPLVKSLAAWSKKHGNGTLLGFPQTVQHARIESGRVSWNQPSGPGTHLEVRGVTLDLAPKEGRPLGEDFVIDPTSVDVTTSLGAMGPWLIDGSRSGPAYTLHFSFNQAHQQSFGIDFVANDETTKIDLRSSRASPADLGMKADVFGAAPADIVKIDASGHAERKGTAWTATAAMTVEGFHVPNAHPATVSTEVNIVGPAGAPLDVQRGRLSLGAGDAPLTGAITILDDAIVMKLASTVTMRCDDGVTRAVMSLALDSRDLGAASLTPQTHLCMPKK